LLFPTADQAAGFAAIVAATGAVANPSPALWGVAYGRHRLQQRESAAAQNYSPRGIVLVDGTAMKDAATARRDAEPRARLDARGLEEAFVRYQDQLLGMLYHLLGNSEDARDALQDAFIRCWKHQDELPTIENLRAWIFRVTLNTGRDLRGNAWRRHRRSLDDGEDRMLLGNTPDAEPLHRERVALVRHAIRQLRPEEQEIFLLRQDGEMTYQQIAEAVSIPLGTVKTRMRTALRRLRESLEGK
jgi:RNA polymerase sigma factor (sigma-70 family)